MSPSEAQPQALSGLRIIDLSRWAAGEYATKLFADFGADVIKIEHPSEGSLTRSWRLNAGDEAAPEASALFLHLNTNKRSIALDFTVEADRAVLLELVSSADALVESFRPGTLERLGVGPDVLLSRNPDLVITRISAFGQDGPYRDYEASGLVVQATGGPMHATGDKEREPLRKPGLLEQYSIGSTAAVATLGGIRNVAVNGHGCILDISSQEALLSSGDRRASYLMSASYSGIDAPRGVRSAHRGRAMFTGPYPATDGYVMVYITNRMNWNRFVEMISGDAPKFRAKFWDRNEILDDRAEFFAFASHWLSVRSKKQIMDAGMEAKIPITALLALGDVLAMPHLREREMFVAADHPVAGALEYLGAPFRMPGGWALHHTAPLLDQHGTELRAEAAEIAKTRADESTTPAVAALDTPARPPLEGIRIVDLTVVWAGPGVTTLLGDMGAEVIRIEANNRATRQISASMTKEQAAIMGYHAAVYPDQDPGDRPYDRGALFNWHSRNKLAANMNLDTPEGMEAARRLIEISDVFVENNAAQTLEKIGLSHEELLRINPRIIVLRMPSMGLSGPLMSYQGYGPNFNSLMGIAAMDGYEGENPGTAGENYHMDEASPMGGAFAVLTALHQRDRTGKGCLIEFSQAEYLVQEIGEYMLEYQRTGRSPGINGNSSPLEEQAVLPMAGEDRWIAITLRTEAQREALAGLLGFSPDLRDLTRRGEVATWTSTQDPDALVARLQVVGIPSGEVFSETQLLRDPHLAARDWFKERTHPSTGTHLYTGHSFSARGMPLVFGRPLPAFGEDNEYVYKTLLGYSDELYDDLVERRLITDVQFA
jgi:crotonobetainyl-CoA:carnitine CoA-transferase CaiB-like acyl-CoA transferase